MLCQPAALQSVTLSVIRFLSFALLLLLVVPGTAVAQSTQAPPGLSAADQYLETVPDAEGNRTVGRGGRTPGAGDRSVDPGTGAAGRSGAIETERPVSAKTVVQMQRQGESGSAAAALAGFGAPSASPGSEDTLEESVPDGALAAIGGVATGGGGAGIGFWFPLFLVLGTAAVAGAAYRRGRMAT